MTAGLVQLSVGDDPAANLPVTQQLVAEAAGQGASLVVTPECTNLISGDRSWQSEILRPEAEDETLQALRRQASDLGIWLLIGSLALKSDDPGETRFVNRSLLVDPSGGISARYDKIHMFDVTISETESFRESSAYRPGSHAVLADKPVRIGMTVCYDLRFPHLYRLLGQAGAEILSIPAAFNDTTGAAHWHVLLRARAIETGSFVLAPAQCGLHEAAHAARPRERRSYGHSLAVSPWGDVLAEAEDGPGVRVVKLDLNAVRKARFRIPAIRTNQPFEAP
ncbi:carbon-nitrogen hydrolase family protein [Paracoccus aerodenitrificans]|uniref:carbon-nitrogen hydrolase family protein n=1 Tax=Paracoccus aerodenitrificans TaxID=3017781 RepID=UPI0022F0AC9B|nr:carbon-nitrogen hydrolase family protein [Paracoccus aerodenitrificans]WBU65737.1 carbon-nitrogen hydrolase family protein [Paracoccus aerodenitrificans]